MEILSSLWGAFSESLMKVLPLSPFRQYLQYFSDLPYLGWLNWLFPVRDCLIVMGVWLTAITTFYLWSVLMRWLKIIGD